MLGLAPAISLLFFILKELYVQTQMKIKCLHSRALLLMSNLVHKETEAFRKILFLFENSASVNKHSHLSLTNVNVAFFSRIVRQIKFMNWETTYVEICYKCF